MNQYVAYSTVSLAILFSLAVRASGLESPDLRLVPYPKHCQLEVGTFSLPRTPTLEAPAAQREVLARLLNDEMRRAGLPDVPTRPAPPDAVVFRISGNAGAIELALGGPEENRERYALAVRPTEIVAVAAEPAGLLYAMQTLCQLIRANRQDDALPCLSIQDWPSLRWRCFQDDMTRGPSSTLDTLRFQAALGAYLKFNLMTYYMEYQFAFQKHPKIGPPNGSLTADELAALVDFAKPLGMEILGNQQSFGHFSRILSIPEYAPLKEGADVVNPLKEETYQLLDDMYAEVCPVLPFPFFNVCCDETWELGRGPTKQLAEEIGVGGVYVRHIRRVHELLTQKYQKRMMMWGDIILQHPERLGEIPKDTIMLTWGYDARDSFEKQIIPFTESGFEFFVCPGVSNWSRILPDFGVATTNIAHFVRDGAKHGALGMINTDWEDDGEAINAVKWYCDAWAAECAWNASTTPLETFNRRVGAVLFGESGDRFGRAVTHLAQTHRMTGMLGMNNRRFWEADFAPRLAPATIESRAQRLLDAVNPAIAELEALKQEATVNQHILDAYLFGARRMQLIGQRMLDGLEAARIYDRAYGLPPSEALPLLTQVEDLVCQNRDAHKSLGQQFATLWLAESKPYALDWTLARYTKSLENYNSLLAKLADTRKAADAGQPLPSPSQLGLALPEALPRRARPHQTVTPPLDPDSEWLVPEATHRLAVVVSAGKVDRHELPIEVELAVPAALISQPVRAFALLTEMAPQPIVAQWDVLNPAAHNKARLAALLPELSAGTQATVFVYLGGTVPESPPTAVSTAEASGGMVWIENDQLRLLLGPEGSHVYRWEIKSLDNRDLTQPGETGWAGFCDIAQRRSQKYRLIPLARGPALVRYQCVADDGHSKTISLYAGTRWIEVTLNEPTDVFWNFDATMNFASDGPNPGAYLFSTGVQGPVGAAADGVPAQVKAPGSVYGIKFTPEHLALGMATPGKPAFHHVAPGAGAGGVGIERSDPASHFVVYGGLLAGSPAETMERLARTLDLSGQPEIVLYGIQEKAAP